ncbi:kelch repeat-containing protein [Bdellovibrio sp. HCB274]|uniref:kelch repeat-containing protein n=1 Tax=Bdellovibrio sp. HCB274 TaxID=3394361 RepID=UPI0039B5A5DF
MNVFLSRILNISILLTFLGILSACTLELSFYEMDQIPSLQPAGVYSSQASRSLYPNSRRVRNTSTTLADGRILVVGGTVLNGPNPAMKEVEFFNPTTLRWSSAPPMAEARSRHTATMLSNGKVLVVGGVDISTYKATAELYNPATNSWSSTGSLSIARANHTATLLGDGRVLIAGGHISDSTYTNSLEIYDPATETFSNAGTLPAARSRHAAVLMPNGKVFIVGGGSTTGNVLTDTEIINPGVAPALPTLEITKPTLGLGRNDLTATVLKNGYVAIIGGLTQASAASALVHTINPDSPATLNFGTPLPTARWGHTATVVNGVLVVTGGFSDGFGAAALSDSLIYTPDGTFGTWTTLGTLKNGVRALHTANVSGDYLVLLNGTTHTSSPVNLAEKIDMSSFTWKREGNLATDRAVHTTTLLQNGKILVAGGLSQNASTATPLDSTEIFDPATGLWTAGPTLPAKRLWAQAVRLNDGKVLIAGGLDGSYNKTATTMIYNPTSNSWAMGPSLTVARVGNSIHLLPDGKVIVMGGFPDPAGSPPTHKTEIFDPATNAWTAGPDMPTPVAEYPYVTLPDQKILIVGGANSAAASSVTNVQTYDPATNSFAAMAPINTGRYQATATLLPTGNVLVTGGLNSGNILATTEIYNVSGNSWSAGPSLGTARRAHSAIALPSGKILVTGGVAVTGSPLIGAASNEIYDSGTNTWFTDPVSNDHVHSLATLVKLANGKIIIAAGVDPNYSSAFTESYIEDQNSGVAWTGNTGLLGGRVGNTTTLMKNGKILFTGGQLLAEAASLTTSTSVYDSTTNTFTAGPNMVDDRVYHTATLLPSGKVFIAGGMSFSVGGASSTGQIYDPDLNSLTTVALPVGRYFHTALVMPDGKLLLTGGIDSTGNPSLQNDVYDPDTGTWSTLAPRTAPSAIDTAFTISDTEIIFIGAFGGSKYDISTDTWSTLASPSFGRMQAVVAKLPSGKIFVTGGTDGGTGNALAASEIYDPTTDTWSTAASLDMTLVSFSHQLRPDGKVVVIGGLQDSAATTAQSTVRVYDPETDQWSFGDSLTEGRAFSSSVLMPDGAIVVFGGTNLSFGMLPFWETLQ